MSNIVMVFPLLIVMSFVIFVPLLVGVYVYRDARRRGMNAPLWTIIAILAPSLIGFIIYLLVRGSYSNLRCPRCDTPVGEQFVVCPSCGAKLRPVCLNCSAPVEPDWKVCPRCAQPLPEVQEDIVTPVRPRDKTLWKILAAIIIIPVVLLLVLGIAFYRASGGGSSSLRETTFDEYFQDQEVPEATKEYVREWLDGLYPPPDINHVYALMYERTYEPERSDGRNDYYYLIYVPGGGEAGRRGFGYSSGLFSDSLKLELSNLSGQDGLYCMATTSKKGGPKLKITLDDRKLDAVVTEVDFNPTLFTIASEYDFSTLTNAAGDLYVEAQEMEMKPDLLVISQIKDGQAAEVKEFADRSTLFRTVVEIHELHYLEEPPAFLDGYIPADYFTLSIHYADTTGEAHYEDASEYMVIRESSQFYLLELIEGSTLSPGRMPDNYRVYEISDEGYEKLSEFLS